MQELVFNTTKRTVKLHSESGLPVENVVIYKFNNIPTVRIVDGYYEVIQEEDDNKKYPVLRVPISNTNMIIEK